MLESKFTSKTEFILAALQLKSPGLGFGGLEEDRDDVYTATIEIPRKGAYRYITALEKDGFWQVVDDFEGPIAYGGTTIQIEDYQLVYRTHEGTEFRRKALK
ncbi:MAG: hypothetical protein ACK4UN_05355 [Limisphaerales bacterium]